MNDKELPGKSWRLRQCKCGCDSFRLTPDTGDPLYLKECRNCKHTLGDHITLAR